MIQRFALGLATLIIPISISVHAEDDPVTCSGRCVMIEDGEGARQQLLEAPRTGLGILYKDELGMVYGADLKSMVAECQARATARTDLANANTRGILVDFLSIYPFGELKAVIDHQLKQKCVADF